MTNLHKKKTILCVEAFAIALATAATAGAPVRPEFLLQQALTRAEPFREMPLRVNPPTFRWPEASGALAFRVELSSGNDFRGALSYTTADTFYRPLHSLASGTWQWRYRREKPAPGPWSKVESFEITSDLPRWDIPEWSALIAHVPAGHPRIYIRPEQVREYRRRAQELPQVLENLSARLKSASDEKFRIEDYVAEVPAAGSGKSTGRQIATKRRWAAKAAGGNLMKPVSDLCWQWLATGDPRAVQEVRRRLMIASKLDPKGFLSHKVSDFGNAAIVGGAAQAYDLLYDEFTPAERAVIRKMLVERGTPLFEELRESAQRPMKSAHGWQHTYAEFTMAALALYREDPVARVWLETALKAFVSSYPWFGGQDGGSHEGISYYTGTEMLSSLETRDLLFAAFGVDLAAGNPWYRNNPYYLMYAFPPNSIRSHIADGIKEEEANDARFPSGKEKLAAQRMASLYGNGYAADYAARIKPGEDPDSTVAFLRWYPFKKIQPVPLDKLSPARLFRDIGTVFMHSAYTRPEENVRMEFKSSPYGGFGHGHSDQNSFNIMAGNEPLLIDSGYYTPFGDPHRQQWSIQTRAHNSVLVDGHGQAAEGTTGYGQIRRFQQTNDWVYAMGSAEAAYKQVSLDRFDRHVVWLKGTQVQTYIIIDDLRAADSKPHRFDWLLHATDRMNIDTAAGRVTADNGKAEAIVSMLEPRQASYSQTGQFTKEAIYWRRGGEAHKLKNQWHLTVTPTVAAPQQRFVAVIQVARKGAPVPRIEPLDGGVATAGWQVRLDGGKVTIMPERK